MSHLRIHRDIEDAIATLRQGSDAYEEAFSAAMDRIDRQQESSKEIAKKALAWITYATRPLETKELQHALALRPTDTVIYETGMPGVDHILSVCVGLVTWDEMSRTFKLVHYTAQQYLEGALGRWFPDAKLYIAKTCLQYLSLEVFDTRESTEYYRTAQYYLYPYAVKSLAYHLRSTSSQLGNEIMQFLMHSCRRNAYVNELVWRMDNELGVSPCHVAAALDADAIIGELLNDGWDGNAPDCMAGSPLVWAAMFGSAKAVRRLLREKDVNVNALTPETPLPKIPPHSKYSNSAPDGGETDFHNLGLLWDTLLMSPLMMACKYGHEDIVAMLLADTRVDLNAADSEGCTALHYACRASRTSIVGLLVRARSISHCDIVLDPVDNAGDTPLYLAAFLGNVGSMKMLLESGQVAVNRKAEYCETPLLCAAEQGDTEAVSLLLQHGADPGQADVYGETPLQRAAHGNHEDVVRMLLQQPQTDSLALDKFGRSALYVAAARGAVSIVRMLLAHQQRDQDYHGTDEERLLKRAFSEELATITRLIRGGRIDANAEGRSGSITRWAVREGHLDITKALLDAGAPVGPKESSHKPSLILIAASKGYIELVDLLLSRGHPASSTLDLESPLHHAVSNAHYEIARLLLREITAAAVPDKPGLLALAAGKEDGRFLDLFIEHGLDPNYVDSYGQSPLRYAVKCTSVTAVERLLEKGASRDLVDEDTLGFVKQLVKHPGSTEILQLLQAEQ